MPRFQCVQFGVCPRADACEEIVKGEGHSFECPRNDPNCHEQLMEIKSRVGGKAKLALIAVPVLLLAGGAIWYFATPSRSSASGEVSVEQALVDVWPWLKQQP